MFSGFQHLWTPLAFSHELGRKPLSYTLAGERVALFRGKDRKAAAVIDRCPHRGVALSKGRVTPEGCLECPFHGWQFAADGSCQHVPYNPMPAEKRANLGVASLPVHEAGGLIWVYTAPNVEAPAPPAMSPALSQPGLSRWEAVKPWKIHWTRAMENMLDVPHLPFIHKSSIGRPLRKTLLNHSQMELEVTPTDSGFGLRWVVDGPPGSLDWYRPNGMVLHLNFGSRKATQHVWCIPVDDQHTRMMIVSTRDFGLYNPLYKLFDYFNLRVLFEDERVLVSSDPVEVPHPSQEKSVSTDMPTLRFRSWYLGHKREETRAKPRPEGDSQFAA
jgi:phenylpropionate dioxygenase-like ring-hydroxylating dioxygenase large terminal subunit